MLAGERTFLSPCSRPVERVFYKLAGVDPAREQSWLAYTMAMLAFSVVGFVSLYALQRLQAYLPLNPQGFSGVPADLAFNTSMSFVTNTNWQNYGGETTMSHLTQMLGLTVHNFVSAATGLAMAFALVRGFSRAESPTIGNFWVDLTRATLYVLLPLSIVVALALVALGVPQTLAGSVEATTLEGAKQTISHRPDGEPGGDQGARHQWRRLLQRQFRASVREPECACPTCWRSGRCSSSPSPRPSPSGAWSSTIRQGRAIAITMGIVLVVGVVSRLLGRSSAAIRC